MLMNEKGKKKEESLCDICGDKSLDIGQNHHDQKVNNCLV